MKILIIEDDVKIINFLKKGLEEEWEERSPEREKNEREFVNGPVRLELNENALHGLLAEGK